VVGGAERDKMAATGQGKDPPDWQSRWDRPSPSVGSDVGMVRVLFDLHGAFVLIVLAVGWAVSAVNKRREATRIRTKKKVGSDRNVAGVANARCQVAEPLPSPLPSLCVVVPAKGVKRNSLRNWRSFLDAADAYDGKVGIKFCVESDADPAFALIRQKILEDEQEEPGAASRRRRGSKKVSSRREDLPVDVVVAGRAATCSQKLHNMISSIATLNESDAFDFVLFLDDDIFVYPTLFVQLVHDFLASSGSQCSSGSSAGDGGDGGVFMATAYPFDVPSPDSGLSPFCVAAYHLRLIIFFSIGGALSRFAWGGCMLFRCRELVEDPHGLVRAWRHGGYSDDLIASAIANARKLRIVCGASAIVAQQLDASEWGSFARYWNYCRRQVFVLDTYCSPFERGVNHMLMAIHAYLSLGFLGAVATNAAALVAASLERFHLVEGGSVVRLGWSSFVFLASLALAMAALWRFVAAAEDLIDLLYSSTGVTVKGSWRGWAKWAKVWAGMCIDMTSFVPAAAMALASPHIEWSRVRYSKKNGKVREVVHIEH